MILQPSNFKLQTSNFNLQPSTFSLQPSAFNLQPSVYNPVAKILMPKMQYPPSERLEVLRHAYQGLFQLASRVHFEKYVDFIDVYPVKQTFGLRLCRV